MKVRRILQENVATARRWQISELDESDRELALSAARSAFRASRIPFTNAHGGDIAVSIHSPAKLTHLQYLPLGEINAVNNALNFSTADLHVIGGCDIYTTKAAGSDKKLYKDIDRTLESQYSNLVELSTRIRASLSPPARTAIEDGNGKDDARDGGDGNRKKRAHTAEIPEIDLSRSSPFGVLSQTSSRRTFAYLIATLNASHPDYDFSHMLRPSDFRKERSLRGLMRNVDSMLYNLRPRQSINAQFLAPQSAPSANSYGNDVWSPRMWTLLDKEMNLRQCERYSYLPQDDPFDGEEGAIWSLHYFFFNKEKKRVCYLYLRGLSVLSHSPVHAPGFVNKTRRRSNNSASRVSVGQGAGKRASYWLGSGVVEQDDLDSGEYEDDDDEMVFDDPGDDEVEVPYMDLDEVRASIQDGYYGYEARDWAYEDDMDMTMAGTGAAVGGGFPGVGGPSDEKEQEQEPIRVRGMSEEIGDSMEM